MRTTLLIALSIALAPVTALAQPALPPPGAQPPAAQPPAAQPPAAQPPDAPPAGEAPGAAAADPAKSDIPITQMQNSAGSSGPVAAPVTSAPTGSPAPALTAPAKTAKASSDWIFDYHGYLRAPLRIGMGKRDKATGGDSETTFHVPVIPDDQYLGWQYTSVNSRAWAELFFSYGNSWAKGTVGLLGFNFTDAAWTEEDAQFGIAQGWVTLTPDLPYENVRMEAKVGSFWNKYGMAGQYDAGGYDTYLFGRTHVLGETVHAEIDLGKLTLWGEQGFGGKRPDPSIYNNARFTLLHHEHAGIRYDKTLELGLHYLYAWSQEEERIGTATSASTQTGLHNGSLKSMGLDAKYDAGIAGRFYLGYDYGSAFHAKTVADALEFNHAYGGGEFNQGFVDNYLEGPTRKSNGNGHVQTLLGQYDFSVANLFLNLDKPGSKFWGEGQDLTLSVFAMMNFVTSQDPDANGNRKIKWGTDVVWNALYWFGAAARLDRVQPDSDIPEQSFGVLSPRIFFKSKWVTHERIILQYSRYFYNQRECAKGAPPQYCTQPASGPSLPEGFGAATNNNYTNTRGAPTTRPDLNVFKLEANMWW